MATLLKRRPDDTTSAEESADGIERTDREQDDAEFSDESDPDQEAFAEDEPEVAETDRDETPEAGSEETPGNDEAESAEALVVGPRSPSAGSVTCGVR
ncbi:hypothetical protein M0R88_09120 [Halorussus gelatinilyticus]|uniref:Uncharacterized protein n=1 Tax=Halorussus gelatinilyticus TaxID=2937524 RepID=A0A8U0IM83_9EURY|nr:hypothetical protein [Halorussus gelatinilyticus]UPW02237.1 hypothetical protein M0R88_09120 [Halorussus gelatinilyticus]